MLTVSFQDCHLLCHVRSLLFGSLFHWILLHVGQFGVYTIHNDLVGPTWHFNLISCNFKILFQLPCGFLPWHYLFNLSNPFCFLDWSSWHHSWGELDGTTSVACHSLNCQLSIFYLLKWSGGETVQPIEGTPRVVPHQVQWPGFCPRPFLPPELLLSAGSLSHNVWRLLNDQVNMILSLYLSLTGLLGNRETIVCSYICLILLTLFNFEHEKQVEHYGSETLMGIVSISLFILALSGPVHLFNSVSWVENLQSRLTFDPPYCHTFFSQGSINVDRSCFKETSRKAFVA